MCALYLHLFREISLNGFITYTSIPLRNVFSVLLKKAYLSLPLDPYNR